MLGTLQRVASSSYTNRTQVSSFLAELKELLSVGVSLWADMNATACDWWLLVWTEVRKQLVRQRPNDVYMTRAEIISISLYFRTNPERGVCGFIQKILWFKRWLYYCIFNIFLGLCFGSFLNVLLFRLDRKEGIMTEDRCMNCLRRIRMVWPDSFSQLFKPEGKMPDTAGVLFLVYTLKFTAAT